jgi:L-threonylcarbamoyladenylate synthase
MLYGNVKLSDNLLKKVNENEKVESPGMKYKHYAPKTKCLLVKTGINQISKINDMLMANNNCCVLGFIEDKEYINIPESRFISLGSKNNLSEISSNIFSCLRKVDRLNCDLAIIEGVEEKNLGLSIMNRLVRACENNII